MTNYGGCCGNGRNPMARQAIFGGSSAPIASFTTSPDPATGAAPLTVAFTDTSTNTPTSWSWAVVGGVEGVDYVYTVGTSASQNPTIRFDTPIDYTVTLTATNAAGSDASDPATVTAQMNATLQAWYDDLAVKPSNALLLDLNTLYNGMEDDGDLVEMDLIHPIAGLETDEQRLKPIKSTSGLDFTNVNSATLAAGGVTGNGSTSYLNLNWIPSTHGSKYQRDSACYGLYSRTDSAVTSNDMGCTDGTRAAVIVPKFTDNNCYSKINDDTNLSATITNSLGLISTRRTASNAKAAFRNGVSLGTATTASIGRPTITMFLACRNVSGVASSFSVRQLSFPFAGSGLVDQLRVYNRIQTYMTSRGIAV